MGNRAKNLELASALIAARAGKIIQSSKIYETEAWGITEQPSFYNQVHVIESEFSAQEILKIILHIEEKMGRIRSVKNAARIIDIDILFFNNEIINEPDLTVPHPEISNRRFVLMPVNEIAPEMIHPVLKKRMDELLLLCKDPLKAVPVTS